MSGPELSIITVSYKDPKGLERTIQSLQSLAKANISFEQIVVDSSPALNEPILAKIPSWPLVHLKEEPRGIYAAMNTGVAAAKGKVLWFLNGGDELLSFSTLEKILQKFLAKEETALVLAGADLYRDAKFLYSVSPKSSLLEALIGEHRQCHQGVLYRRQDFLSVAGSYAPQYRLAADYHLHWRFFLAGKKAEIIPLSLVKYDMGGSSSKYREVFAEYRKIHREIASQLPASLRWKNAFLRWGNYLKLLVIKGISESGVGPKLRPLWLWYQRK